ncbi:hypothetical protein FB45DRAFT_799928 [Roridomyces roridus]|uniref:Cyclin N-terminal domain-containing protein n=1 Tax=Roridomyces roridus TaxID=1738132 RepID=A0AAD7BFJ4_9AGAR|nr:hypothetical protein FB45DRAFT_799928 [Roridomyces roridus]
MLPQISSVDSSPPRPTCFPKTTRNAATTLPLRLSRGLIDYVVDCVSETVDHALSEDNLRLSRRGRCAPGTSHQKLTAFVSFVLSKACITPAILLTSLVYIVRLRSHLLILLEQRAPERVFLGALAVASKYTQDSSLKNTHWARFSGGVFNARDVGLIEREVLAVLDWDLRVREGDLFAHREGLLRSTASSSSPARPEPLSSNKRRRDEPSTPGPVDGIPELDPSSPLSSAGSTSSPRTPVWQHQIHAATPPSFPTSPSTPGCLSLSGDNSPVLELDKQPDGFHSIPRQRRRLR